MDMPNKLLSLLKLIRFDRPTGTFLLFFPCSFGVALAARSKSDVFFLLTFFLGSIIMRSAGCIINDIIDMEIDGKVERTKNRPLVTGEVTVHEAMILLGVLIFSGLFLLMNLSFQAIVIGMIVMVLVVIYPMMKRITYWPQAFLGITYSSGVLIAYSSVAGHISIGAFLTYLGCVCWTIGYDTIYAFMDARDDESAGVKSTALFLKDRDHKLWLGAFYGAFWLFSIIGALLEGHYSVSALALGTIGVVAIFVWQLQTLDLNSSDNCLDRFKSSSFVGLIWMVTLLY